MIGKISFWIKLPIGYFLIWDTHRQKPGRVLTEPDRLSSLSRTGSSPSRTGLFLASLRGAPHGPSKSRTGFELRSTILPLHQTYQPFLTEMGLGLRMEGPHRAGQACFISTKLFRIRFLLLCLVWLLRLVLIGRSLRLF